MRLLGRLLLSESHIGGHHTHLPNRQTTGHLDIWGEAHQSPSARQSNCLPTVYSSADYRDLIRPPTTYIRCSRFFQIGIQLMCVCL